MCPDGSYAIQENIPLVIAGVIRRLLQQRFHTGKTDSVVDKTLYLFGFYVFGEQKRKISLIASSMDDINHVIVHFCKSLVIGFADRTVLEQ